MKLARKTSVQVTVMLTESEASDFERVAKKLKTDSISETVRAMIQVALRAQ